MGEGEKCVGNRETKRIETEEKKVRNDMKMRRTKTHSHLFAFYTHTHRHDKTVASLEGKVKALLAQKEAAYQETERTRVRREGGREGGKKLFWQDALLAFLSLLPSLPLSLPPFPSRS